MLALWVYAIGSLIGWTIDGSEPLPSVRRATVRPSKHVDLYARLAFHGVRVPQSTPQAGRT
jgi:hypothetical protein